jgi:hypothetical protein
MKTKFLIPAYYCDVLSPDAIKKFIIDQPDISGGFSPAMHLHIPEILQKPSVFLQQADIAPYVEYSLFDAFKRFVIPIFNFAPEGDVSGLKILEVTESSTPERSKKISYLEFTVGSLAGQEAGIMAFSLLETIVCKGIDKNALLQPYLLAYQKRVPEKISEESSLPKFNIDAQSGRLKADYRGILFEVDIKNGKTELTISLHKPLLDPVDIYPFRMVAKNSPGPNCKDEESKNTKFAATAIRCMVPGPEQLWTLVHIGLESVESLAEIAEAGEKASVCVDSGPMKKE